MFEIAWKVVNDGYSGDYDEWAYTYVISSNHCDAKRKGAFEMGTEYEYVTAYREPNLDKYASLTYIPPEILIKEYGWEYECDQCYTKIAYDWGYYTEDEEGEPIEITPVFIGKHTYCSQKCRETRLAEIENIKKEKAEAAAKALEKYKQAEIIKVYRTTKDKKEVWAVELKLPYLQYTAYWIVDDTHISICEVDLDNYLKYKENINNVE